jgi:hypothetical protein
MQAEFIASEKYSPNGKIDSLKFNGQAYGDRIGSTWNSAGQQIVTITAWEAGKEVARKQLPVFVGMKPEKDVVCRLLMKGALQDGMKSWIWHGGWDKVDYTFIPDASGSNNFGFLAGGSWVKDDQRRLVLELDGKRERVEISNSADLNTGKSYPQRSVAFWFRAKTLDNGDAKKKPLRQVLYEEGGSGSGLNLYLDGDTLFAGVWKQPDAAWLRSKKLTPEVWHHVALVLKQAKPADADLQATLYLDGAKVAEAKGPLLAAHPGDINLGRSGGTAFHDSKSDNPGHYFAGRLDDFRIANRAFSEAELRALAK